MAKRVEGGVTYEQGFDVENRLVSVAVGNATTSFAYDASGQRVMTVEPGGKTTYFPFPGYSEEMVGTTVTTRRVTYTIAGQAVASRVQLFSPTASNTLYRLYTDHLGSTVTQSTMSGGTVGGANTYYLPYGSYRGAPPTQTLTDHDFTGQRENRELGLLYYNARFYVPSVGRFASPDTIVPDPANPQQFNRYSYVNNNPINHSDQSGNCIFAVVDTIACILVASKVIDYGLTGWDIYQAGRTLANPNASADAKLMAGLTVGLSIIFEAIEPDDILPVGIPGDDIARRAIISGAEEALEAGGPEALEGYLRNQLGDYADDALAKADELLGIDNVRFYEDPGKLQHIFRDSKKGGHLLEDTLENRNFLLDTVSRNNFINTNEYGNQVFARILDDGSEAWVFVRNGIIQNGGVNQIPKHLLD